MSEKEITERIIQYARDIKEKGGIIGTDSLLREIAIQLFSIQLRLYHLTLLVFFKGSILLDFLEALIVFVAVYYFFKFEEERLDP